MKLVGYKGSFQRKETKPGYEYWYQVWYDPVTKKMQSKCVGKTLPSVNHDREVEAFNAKQTQNRADLRNWYETKKLNAPEGDG